MEVVARRGGFMRNKLIVFILMSSIAVSAYAVDKKIDGYFYDPQSGTVLRAI
jgi:hypothetical protein